jgi:FMNH2-dependent dimethyl sulfone monooxygenase
MIGGERDAASSPWQRVRQSDFLLGLFLPIEDGGRTPSGVEQNTRWNFGCNAQLVRQAEALGFDLAFALAQRMGKGGYGGEGRDREQSLDPLTAAAGLASLTKRMLLVSTVHILYGWHPLHIAKFGATLDQMTGGRWGINIVTGHKKSEYAMFGMAMPEHDRRYEMAEEFVAILERLWRESENLSFGGRFWSGKDAYVAPKPRGGRPMIVSTGTSAAGVDFAARRSDLIFVPGFGGADVEQALADLGPRIAHIKRKAARYGRDIKCIVNPHIVCRDTEREAQSYLQRMRDDEDDEAVDSFVASILADRRACWQRDHDGWIGHGDMRIVGSPEQVVNSLARLKAAGCDGVQINFFDFESDLKFFGERVIPLMHQTALRKA